MVPGAGNSTACLPETRSDGRERPNNGRPAKGHERLVVYYARLATTRRKRRRTNRARTSDTVRR